MIRGRGCREVVWWCVEVMEYEDTHAKVIVTPFPCCSVIVFILLHTLRYLQATWAYIYIFRLL
jgi:hypothetical protein